jgi:GntR family transcriptional regulator
MASRSPVSAKKTRTAPSKALGRPVATRRAVVGTGPLYRQVVQALRDRILNGTYALGQQLPTESELLEEFGVSRNTVREALRQLRQDGLVASRQGSGSVVTRRDAAQGYVHRVDSVNELITYAGPVRFRVDASAIMDGPDEVVAQMGARSSRMLVLEGYHFLESDPEVPVCRTRLFVDQEFAGVERIRNRHAGPIFEMIEDLYGVRVAELRQVLTARKVPSAEIAQTLGISEDDVVIEAARIYTLTSGKVAQLALSLYPANKFQSTITLRRVDQ